MVAHASPHWNDKPRVGPWAGTSPRALSHRATDPVCFGIDGTVPFCVPSYKVREVQSLLSMYHLDVPIAGAGTDTGTNMFRCATPEDFSRFTGYICYRPA